MKRRVIAIGDIHGCLEGLKSIVEEKLKLKKADRLILLGDYIDRGPDSKEVLDYILNLNKRGYNIVSLMGNHERLLLDAVESKMNYSTWIYNGGDSTLASFGVDSPKEINEVYIDFLKSLPYYYILDNFIFVHAGFNDDIEDPFKDQYSMIWFSNDTYKNPMLSEKIIIHGHYPITVQKCRENILKGNKVIGIDTGYVYSGTPGYGYLTAIEINSMELFHYND